MAEHLAFLQSALEQQSEAWKKPHNEVMECYGQADRLTEFVAFYLFVHGRIMRVCDGDGTGTRQFTVSIAKSLCGFLKNWFFLGQELLADVEDSQAADYPIEDSDKLRKAHRAVGEMMHGVAKLSESIKSYEDGEARTLTDVMHELRASAS